jgi:hypothetical protein
MSFFGAKCFDRTIPSTEEISRYRWRQQVCWVAAFLYEFGLLINDPLDGVTDIHGLAADSSGLPRAWHCVLSQEAEQACARDRVTLDGSKLIIFQNEVKKNFLMTPVNGKGRPQKVSDSAFWPFHVCVIGCLFV